MAAAERVRERLLRATAALDAGQIPYAVVGGNAVAVWVSRIDAGGVCITPDVDILIRREDFDFVQAALTAVGFTYHESSEVDTFIDGPQGGARDAVHLLFAGEKAQPEHLAPTPDLTESERGEHFQVVSLAALVRMKLTSYRDQGSHALTGYARSWPARCLVGRPPAG